jgi:hypothetical protein
MTAEAAGRVLIADDEPDVVEMLEEKPFEFTTVVRVVADAVALGRSGRA